MLRWRHLLLLGALVLGVAGPAFATEGMCST
jgi:hypothetical protein